VLRTPTKRFGREVITRVPFSGNLVFKFVPEAGHPDRALSTGVNVVIYFKSHHSRLVLHCSHILVNPGYYLSTLFSLFQSIVHTLSPFYTISLYCLHYTSALFILLQCSLTIFKCIIYTT